MIRSQARHVSLFEIADVAASPAFVFSPSPVSRPDNACVSARAPYRGEENPVVDGDPTVIILAIYLTPVSVHLYITQV